MYFPTADDIVRLNKQFMTEANEHFAVLFYGTLEGCVEKVHGILFDVELYPGMYEKAAALMHCIITRSPFENGNKRTGMAAALVFLEMNGVIVDVNVDESVEFCRKIANLQVEITEIASWLREHTRGLTYLA